MALIKCPECGAEISDKAPKCPKCGRSIKNNNKKIVIALISIVLVLAIVTLQIPVDWCVHSRISGAPILK